jgi:hypothetical protein
VGYPRQVGDTASSITFGCVRGPGDVAVLLRYSLSLKFRGGGAQSFQPVVVLLSFPSRRCPVLPIIECAVVVDRVAQSVTGGL